MGVEVTTEFIGKSTIMVRASIYDDNDNLADPTSCKFTIIDPNGLTVLDNQTYSAKETAGIYRYYYKTTKATEKGDWRGEVEVIDGAGDEAKTSMANFAFTIV